MTKLEAPDLLSEELWLPQVLSFVVILIRKETTFPTREGYFPKRKYWY